MAPSAATPRGAHGWSDHSGPRARGRSAAARWRHPGAPGRSPDPRYQVDRPRRGTPVLMLRAALICFGLKMPFGRFANRTLCPRAGKPSAIAFQGTFPDQRRDNFSMASKAAARTSWSGSGSSKGDRAMVRVQTIAHSAIRAPGCTVQIGLHRTGGEVAGWRHMDGSEKWPSTKGPSRRRPLVGG